MFVPVSWSEAAPQLCFTSLKCRESRAHHDVHGLRQALLLVPVQLALRVGAG